jgi:hypothetical protein
VAVVRWKRAAGDHVESHCGRWRISPLYCGRTRPEAFVLWDGERQLGEFMNQRDAKVDAEERAQENTHG